MIAAVDPAAAREAARDVLADRRFRRDPAPRPFRGALEWVRDRLDTVGDAIHDAVTAIPLEVWIALLALVAAGVVHLTREAAHRRAAAPRPAGAADGPPREDAAALEREADAAQRRGELARAIRLRFRAGLLRLGARGAIDYRPSVTVREVRREVASPLFDELAGTFEEVAYGGRAASPPDAEAARTGWPRVLQETSRR